MIGKELVKKRLLFGIEKYEDVSMSSFCTMRVGGKAEMVCFPKSICALKRVCKFTRREKMRLVTIGAGSNLLFGDDEFFGVVVGLKNLKPVIKSRHNLLYCSAQTMLSRIAEFAKEKELSGLEFATGIPAQVGGAVVMNAGAFGSSMADIVRRVLVLCGGKTKWINAKDCRFGYRTSIFKQHEMIVLGVELCLTHRQKDEITKTMIAYSRRRQVSQPKGFSCGSVFKNPPETYAGFLIEKAGLKGARVGGAEISSKHANFIINTGNATIKDVKDLIKLVQTVVFEKFSIELQLEIEIIGENYDDTRRLPHT